MKTVSKKLLSILLVAVLLISAVPFQAFAEHDPDLHTELVITSDGAGKHFAKCTAEGCSYEGAPEPCEYYDFDGANHICSKCGYAAPIDHNFSITVEPAVAATCTSDGKTATLKCSMCNLTTGGEIIHTEGHNWSGNVCTICGATQTPVTKNITLVAGDGHTFADGSTSKTVSVEVGKALPVFENPADPNGEFRGWYIDGTTNAPDPYAPYDGTWTKLVPHWVSTSYELKVYSVLNNQISTANYIGSWNVTPGTKISTFVENNGILSHEKLIHPGYRLVMNAQDYPVKKYIGGVLYPLSNTDVANGQWTVYVNLTPALYDLTLNANGGSVTPGKVTGIAYGTTVTLPTPTKMKAVFQGWKDINNNIYKGSMAYNFTENTTLTAVWSDEASVMLKIYINGNFSVADRIVELTQYVKESKIFRSDVVSVITKNYVASGGTLSVAGLFDAAGWASYQANRSKLGDEFYEVKSNDNYIYVMLTNAAAPSTSVNGSTAGTGAAAGGTSTNGSGVPNNGNAYWVSTGTNTGYWVYTNGTNGTGTAGTTGTSNGTSSTNPYWVPTGNGTGYWVYPNGQTTNSASTNPKTGDTAMVEAAAAIMILAAAALVVTVSLRKRKFF